MPTNRRPKPAEEKRAELINSARTLFIEQGYESTSMNRIAKHAGVTPNTLYWYFEDKDALFISVLDELLSNHLEQYQNVRDTPLADQLFWITKSLKSVSRMVSTLHTRIQFSEKLDRWHTGFHQVFNTVIESQLVTPLPDAIREAELRIVAFTMEGLISHDISEAEIKHTCDALAARCLSIK